MKKLLENSRYLAIIGVLGLLVASLAGFLWGVFQTYHAISLMIESLGKDPGITVALIEIVDSFLIAVTFLIFAVGMYELFIGDLNMPSWMEVHDIYALKSKLSSMIVMVMGVKFLEKLVEVKDYGDLLMYGAAVALVSAVLIAFGYLVHKD